MNKPQTIAQLKRRIERLEAQVQAAQDLNLRIAGADMNAMRQNSDMRVILRQIADMAGAASPGGAA